MRLEARAAAEPRATPELRPWGNAVDAREVAAATTLVILNNMLGCCGRPLLNKSMYEWDFAWALTSKKGVHGAPKQVTVIMHVCLPSLVPGAGGVC